MENKHEMHIEKKKITSENFVKLLVIEIDNQLNFDNTISFPEKKTLTEAFAFSNFNTSFSLALYLHDICKQN